MKTTGSPSAYSMCIKLSILKLNEAWGIKLEVIDMDLFRCAWDLRFVRLRSPGLHVVSVVLVNRVIAFTLPLCWLDPDQVFPLLKVSSCRVKDTEAYSSRTKVLAFPLIDHAFRFEVVQGIQIQSSVFAVQLSGLVLTFFDDVVDIVIDHHARRPLALAI